MEKEGQLKKVNVNPEIIKHGVKKVKVQMTSNFTNMLTVLFIGLKLTHHIDWSWIWVCSPIVIFAVFQYFVGIIKTIEQEKNTE